MNTHPLISLVTDKSLMEFLAEEFGTPLYLYSAERLKENLNRLDNVLKENFNKYRICYAIKANNNPNLVRTMRLHLPTLGGDCSSPGELRVAELAGIPFDECIYTGNYESSNDLQSAFNAGAHINLDDISSFYRLTEVGLPKEITFRLNPGFGKGRFVQIVTAGDKAKFGVPQHGIVKAYRLAKESGIKEFGLQCMTGSGILDVDYFSTLLTTILENARKIETKVKIRFNFISIGGGFGIPYHEEETPLDIEKVFINLKEIFYSYYDRSDNCSPALWVEPGKYLVGDAGVLLTRVIGIKESYRTFIGLDAGMESLMRPALYNAYHRIIKVGEPEQPDKWNVDFTGRICENTDRLAVDRLFPKVNEKDLIAIMDVGAYGFSMAHQFNTRPRPAEIILEGTTPRLIRRRETIGDIFRSCDV